MTTIEQAFETMRQGLELTANELTNAENQAKAVRAELDGRLGGIKSGFISGSFGRRTAIRPLHDIDFFVILDSAKHADVYPSATVLPSAILKRVKAALEAAYPNNTVRLQNRSVNIVFASPAVGYDVVPAFETKDGLFMIPDRGRDAWIQTNPAAHKTALDAANTKAGSKLDALVKMAKYWNGTHGKHLRSFHLEVMAHGAFQKAPESYPEGVRQLFAHLAKAVLEKCPDPAGAALANIEGPLTPEKRKELATLLQAVADEAKKALDLGRTPSGSAQAHAIWKGLFGGAYSGS